MIYIAVVLYNSKLNSISSPKHPEKQQHQLQDLISYNNNNIISYQNQLSNNNNSSAQLKGKIKETSSNAQKHSIKKFLNKCFELVSGESKDSIQEKFLNDKQCSTSPNEKVLLHNDQYSKKYKIGIETKLYAFVEDVLLNDDDEKDQSNRFHRSQYEKLTNEEDDEDNNGFGFVNNFLLRWFLMPFIFVLYMTMPVCCSWITFLFSIGWLSILSYLTVWAISGMSK